jgi:hypothetical protein
MGIRRWNTSAAFSEVSIGDHKKDTQNGDTIAQSEVLIVSEQRDVQHWEHLCQGIPGADVYFLPQYAQIYARKGDGIAHCFIYRSANGLVLYPFLLRRVNDVSLFQDADECWDIITPYGYGGPLYSSTDEASLAQLITGFLESFHTYCHKQRIVSEFARLHPLLDNYRFLPETNKVFHHETVYIDLRQSERDLWKEIRKGHKSSVKKALRFQVKVIRDEDWKYIKQFHKLYTETMRRQQASPPYFFPLSFFEDTLELLEQHASLFVALHDEKVVTAAIFMHYGDYVQYHFSGSDANSLHLCTNHLLIYEVAKWAQEQGAQFFHLGGGLQPNDSLFIFKSGFSSKRAPFYTYRRIHDPDCYQRLVQRKLEDERLSGSVADEGFFPRYRA